jgi:hypothetical protein
MKTLQRQNTKREIVKKVRFQKNEFNDKGMIKNPKTTTTTATTTATTTTTTATKNIMQQQLQQSDDSSVVPANFESSLLDSNAVVDETHKANEEVNEEANEEDVKESRDDAITLSLTE